MNLLKSSAILICLCIALAACMNPGENTQTTSGNPQDPVATPSATPWEPFPEIYDPLLAGKTMYKNHCAKCHNEKGTGGKVVIEGKTLEPADLTSEKVRKMSEEDMTRRVSEGVEDKGMPSFREKLHPEAIVLIVRYVRYELQNMPPN